MRTCFGWVAVVAAVGVFEAGPVAAGMPSTTTTTTVEATTTTTTLLGGCVVDASFESVLCRLDALIAEVQVAGDLGRLKDGIVTAAEKARKQAQKAAGATGRTASNQLKKGAKSLESFRHKLDSNNAKKLIPEATRALLRDQASAVRADVNTLRGSL